MEGTDGGTVVAMPTSYGLDRPRWRPPLTDATVIAMAVAAAAATRSASLGVAVLVAVGLGVVLRAADLDAARWMVAAVVLTGVVAGLRAGHEHDRLVPRHLGPFDGSATVVGEPRDHGDLVRAVLRIDGQRFETWVRGTDGDALRTWRGGQLVAVRGERLPLAEQRGRRVASQHIVGRFRLTGFDETPVATGSPVDQASNVVRSSVERGAAALVEPHDALFRGLVIGDRRDQPAEMVERFRASGLAHLTVVSGLNVALLLAAASPGLRRMRPTARWLATLLLVAWFASLTRFEPSIVRAGAMAALSATAFVSGRDRAPFRLLCLAVVVLLVVDPLLVHATGFWLSVGATAGVCTIGPWLAARIPGPQVVAAPLGVTVGAQVGVAPPLVAAFGHLPLVSVPANLLAVPVASLVKLYGLPASLVAGWVPALAGPLMAPCRLGVRWVDAVATHAAAAEPGGALPWVGWAVLLGALGVVVARRPR